jgi:septum site-determining protein MinD
LNTESDVAEAYEDAVARLMGEERALRFVDEPKKGFLARMFGG